jgi:CheY-like chemotaxis protein
MSGEQGDAPAAAVRRLLLVADDLITPSRVREGARVLGFEVVVAATDAMAREAAQAAPTPDVIFVNLTARRYDPSAIIRDLKAAEDTRKIPLLAFAGHIEKEKHAAARAAGADLVAANSSVALHLPALLSRLLGEAPAPDSTDISDLETAPLAS